eukprot:g2978.t1
MITNSKSRVSGGNRIWFDMASRRSRRQPKASKSSAALERLRRQRAGETVEEEEEDDDIYDLVDEAKYREIVRNRRKQSDFVVDDDGTGYYDDGEEHLFDEVDDRRARARSNDGPTFRGMSNTNSKSKKAKGGALSRAALERSRAAAAEKNAIGAEGTRNIGAMFLGMNKMKKAKKKKKSVPAAAPTAATGAAAGDFDLDSLLDDLVEAPVVEGGESLASMSAAALKTPALRQAHLVHTGVKRKIGSALLDSPSGTVAKKQPRVSFAAGTKGAAGANEMSSAAGEADDDVDMGGASDDGGLDDGDDVPMNVEGSEPVQEQVGASESEAARKTANADAASVSSSADSSAVAPASSSVMPLSAANKNSRFLAYQRQRKAAKQKKLADEKAKAAARAAKLQEATRRAVSAQNAAINVTRGSGGWWDHAGNGMKDAGVVSVQSSSKPSDMLSSVIENATDEDGDTYKCVRMFFLDAYERSDRIYLFGKVWVPDKAGGGSEATPGIGAGSYQSMCMQVRGLERQLFFLPRAWETPDDIDKIGMYNEIKDLLQKSVLRGSRDAFRCKFVERNYAFELPGVPRAPSTYVKCKYSAKYPTLEEHQMSGKTFSKVFGAKTKCLENFLVKRRIMGPCWIEIKDPSPGTNASWCKVEGLVDDPKSITVCTGDRKPEEAPTVRVMSLSIKTRVNKKQEHEVAMVSALIHEDVVMDKPTPLELKPSQIRHFTACRSVGNVGQPGHISVTTKKELDDARKKGEVSLKVLGNSERGLLQFTMSQISKFDPDILVGHNILGHSVDVLMHRMSKLKVSNWSRLGRLNLATFPRAYRSNARPGQRNFDRLAVGRLIVDTYTTAKELVRSESVYSLKALAKKYCGAERREIQPLDVPNYFSSAKALVHLQRHTENGCFLSLKLMFKLEMVPLTKQLTNLGGNLWARTLAGGRAERIEYLLLHEFHRRKYIVPDKGFKKSAKSSKRREASKYAGGLVLEPKKGLYDKFVLLLDFNSLYPSIIQEYNICFTTVTRQLEGEANVDNKGATEAEQKAAGGDGMSNFQIPDLPDQAGANDREWAVLPTLLRTLIQRRSVVKRALKQEQDPVKKRLLHNKQLALKLTANSMYGCLGFKHSRFYAAPIAALVTQTGREILQNTCDLATGMGLDVIYGDTDSIMIYTNSTDLEKVTEIGRKVKREVNKLYRLLEIEIDGVYKTMLLLKKKKYAAIMVEDRPDGSKVLKKETKGLDLVRRDWCNLSKDVGHHTLDLILSGKETEEVVEGIHDHLGKVAAKVKAGEYPLEKFAITKGLSKAPKDYPNAKSMPHVMVALDMVKNGRPVNVGDHIPYVICNEVHPSASGNAQAKDKSNASAAARAYHPDAVKAARERFQEDQAAGSASVASSPGSANATQSGKGSSGSKPALTIDTEWYLSQQILPPTERLCDPIEGTSRAIIADHLGLDAKKYNVSSSFSGFSVGDGDLVNYVPSTQLTDEVRFKDCRPFVVSCPSCKCDQTFPGVFRWVSGGAKGGLGALPTPESGLICVTEGCGHRFTAAHVQNMLDMAIREMTTEYYQGWSRCTEATCGNATRQQSCLGGVCVVPRCGCNTVESFSAGALYTQLKYFDMLFDIKLKDKLGLTSAKSLLGQEQLEDFQLLKSRVMQHLNASDYQWIRPEMWKSVFGGRSSGLSKRIMA